MPGNISPLGALPKGDPRTGVRQPKIPVVKVRLLQAGGPRRPPQPTAGPKRVEEFITSDRNQILPTIAAYARGRRTVVLTYRKKTDYDRIRVLEVEPYALRYQNSSLYAFCLVHQSIHRFLVSRIVSVRGTNRRFVPRWSVEF